jgi:hypothetical protein
MDQGTPSRLILVYLGAITIVALIIAGGSIAVWRLSAPGPDGIFMENTR